MSPVPPHFLWDSKLEGQAAKERDKLELNHGKRESKHAVIPAFLSAVWSSEMITEQTDEMFTVTPVGGKIPTERVWEFVKAR